MTADRPLVMLVEDDAHIADMLLNYLQASGFDTVHLADGLATLNHLKHPPRQPELLLLDLMLPGMDGLSLCREVRQFSAVPIVMVTARVDEVDRLLGLDTGADDYICKPFSPREVVARVRAHLRRASGSLHMQAQPSPEGRTGPPWEVLASHQQVLWRGKPLPFTPVEFRLMALLASRPGQVFGRARLVDELHEDQRDVSDRAVDSHIKNMRRKLLAAGADAMQVASVYGVGYRFEWAG